MSKYQEMAKPIREMAAELGVNVRGHDGIVTVFRQSDPGDATSFHTAAEACERVLRQFPMIRPGSVWGTDSGSVGGAIGLRDGYCRLNKSGVNKLLVREFAS